MGWKKLSIVLMMTLMIMIANDVTAGDFLLPSFNVGSATVQTYGWLQSLSYGQGQYREDLWIRVRADSGKFFGQSKFHPYCLTQKDNGEWEAFGNQDRMDTLYMGWKGDGWALQAGRITVGAAYSTPPPYFGQTIGEASTPFCFYGWGLQLVTKSEKWETWTDFTGASNTSPWVRENWDHWEFSHDTVRKFGEVKIGIASQISPDFWRSVIRLDATIGPTYFRTAFYYAEEEDGTLVRGGHILSKYRLPMGVSPYFQLDVKSAEPRVTVGTEILVWKRLLLALDHEYLMEEKEEKSIFKLLFKY